MLAWLGAVSQDLTLRRTGKQPERRPRSTIPAINVGCGAHLQPRQSRRFCLRRYGRRRSQRAIMASTVLLAVIYAAVTWLSFARFHDRALRDAATELGSIGSSVEIATSRSLLAVSALLFGAAQAVEALPPATSLSDPAVGALLHRFCAAGPPACDILLLDHRGRLVNATTPAPGPRRNYAASPFFAAHLERRAPPLFVGLTKASPSAGQPAGRRSLILSRVLIRDGRFAGVIAAAVPATAFAAILRRIAGETGVEASLFLDHGALIAAEPDQPGDLGKRDRKRVAGLAKILRRGSNGGRPISAGFAAGEHGKLRNIRRLAAFPLVVAVARRRADILPRWDCILVASLVGTGVFAVTATMLTWLIVRALNRRELATLHLRRSEARYKRQNALLQSTLESMTEGLSVFTRSGRLVAWNQRFCELLDLPAVALGMSLREILMHQAMHGGFGAAAPELEVENHIKEFYLTPQTREYITAAGRILQIHRSAMPDGAILSMYADITDLKNSEKKLIEARHQAELANQAKSEFLANMSHELRTPLNAVIGFSEIISNQLFGPLQNSKYLEYINDIHGSSLHLLSIINDVLDMSKIEAGKLNLMRQGLRLQSVAATALRILRERASSRKIALIADFAAEDIVIQGDERALKQVFLNLVANAIKFSHEGGMVRLRIRHDAPARVSGAAPPTAIVEIEDHGIGMTVQELERALEPFGQAQAATTRTYSGTGLGLPITKGLVEAHGGQLTIASQPGEGTTVTLVLPIEQIPAPDLELQPADAAAE
jgi:signal transduction histidine kinase